MNPSDKAYNCDRCGEHTPDGDGRYHNDNRLCCDCAEVVAFWETIEHNGFGNEEACSNCGDEWATLTDTLCQECHETNSEVQA